MPQPESETNVREFLNPHDRAGENDLPRPEPLRSAYDVKEVHDQLRNLPDDVLKQIPILDTGTRLEEGATYFDLSRPERGELTGMNNMQAEPGNCYIAKSDIEYELWNFLTGVTDNYRLGRYAVEAQTRR